MCTLYSSCPDLEDIPGALVDVPGYGKVPSIAAYQFDTYTEVETFQICTDGIFNIAEGGYVGPWAYSSGDSCKDLGIDDENCEDLQVPVMALFGIDNILSIKTPTSCIDKVVIDAMLESAGDPSSFMNSHGPSPEMASRFNPEISVEYFLKMHSEIPILAKAGASMFPRFDDEFFAKLLNETSEVSNHLQHGAALQVHPDAIAYPWRNAALMVDFETSNELAHDFLNRIVEGGYTPQGYYAYLNPPGMKKWRSYFFGDKWRDLTKIRAKYDPKDVFGKPLTIESIGED